MDAVLLARIQFALTIGFHFIFPPVTIGMAWLITWMFWKYHRTQDGVWRQMGRFWLKIFALTFAVGVATGITMEFQFGTNWAAYSRYVGDIFGAPLAAEGVLAFFLESTFMGLLLFGEKRLSTRMQAVSAFMVAFGSTLSGFWIIVANSWQQTPAGYRELPGGGVELTDFGAAVFNPSTIPRYLHTIDAALVTGSFFMLGLSAWYILKGRHREVAQRSARLALIVAFVSSIALLAIGHGHAIQVGRTQPVKLAAFEGHFETGSNAPMLLFGIPDAEAGETRYSLAVPGGLSMLVGNSPDTVVQGLNDFPRDEWPPLLMTFVSFHLMFLLGFFFIGYTSLGVLLLWRKKLFDLGSTVPRLFWRVALFAFPLPIVANELGWIAAEVGRQPWAVWHLLRTEDAVSISVPAWQVLASIIMFTVIYSLLGVLWVFLLKRKLEAGPDPLEGSAAEEVAS